MPNAESLLMYQQDAGPIQTTGNLSLQATKKDTARLMRSSLSLPIQHRTSINVVRTSSFEAALARFFV